MIYAILTVWLVFGMFLAYCLFYFSNPSDRWLVVAIWPLLLAWAIICFVWFGIEAVSKTIHAHLSKDEP